MKKTVTRGVFSAIVLALATFAACATDPTGDDDETDVTSQAVTNSFTATCFNTRVSKNSQPVQAITDAWAFGGCTRRDGSRSGSQHYSGLCFTDVSNCDGRLVCQNHCP
jgi:hypothetical protein